MFTPKRRHTNFEVVLLRTLWIPIKEVPVRRGKWLAWSKPLHPILKLNTDGSRRGSVAVGGGVLRDHSGEFLLGFAGQYSHDDIIQAALDAILHGLQICKIRSLGMVEVETDSKAAFNLITQTTTTA